MILRCNHCERVFAPQSRVYYCGTCGEHLCGNDAGRHDNLDHNVRYLRPHAVEGWTPPPAQPRIPADDRLRGLGWWYTPTDGFHAVDPVQRPANPNQYGYTRFAHPVTFTWNALAATDIAIGGDTLDGPEHGEETEEPGDANA